ncbi:unnamed protein product [Choristocarpus tenellus]
MKNAVESSADRARGNLRALCLVNGFEPPPAPSPLISTRNLVPELSTSVVKLDRLGQGATSCVFRAVHAATMRMVALKEVSVSSDDDRRVVRSEVQALRTQRSPLMDNNFTAEVAGCPRIVEYYGSVVRENGNACIAVEYVAGGSLQSWTDNGRQCPEPWVANLAYQALEALIFLHSLGRVHRDVKPANLLITSKGDLKLADFGVAGEENCESMVGTRRFMAPERLKGDPVTGQSDLWSLGLSLATAAMGESPVSQAYNEFEQLLLAEHAQQTITASPSLSPTLTNFLKLCLSPNPEERPSPSELMRHPFLALRHDWEQKCPQVTRTIQNQTELQGSLSSLSPAAVVEAVIRARMEDNLHDQRLDVAMCEDLAGELGMDPHQLLAMLERGIRSGSTNVLNPGDLGGDDSSYLSPTTGCLAAPVSSVSERGESMVAVRGVHQKEGGCCEGGNSEIAMMGRTGNHLSDEIVDTQTKLGFDTPMKSRNVVQASLLNSIFHVADRLKAEIPVQQRIHRMRVYPECFTGSDAVRWMMEEGLARNVPEAISMGNEMMKAGIFEHICNEHIFENLCIYYQFTDGKSAPEMEGGMRNIGKIARVVGRKVVCALSPGSNRRGSSSYEFHTRPGGFWGGSKSRKNTPSRDERCPPRGPFRRRGEQGVSSSTGRIGLRAGASGRGILPPQSRKHEGIVVASLQGLDAASHIDRGSSATSSVTIPETPL